jgi:hypothetical protein
MYVRRKVAIAAEGVLQVATNARQQIIAWTVIQELI